MGEWVRILWVTCSGCDYYWEPDDDGLSLREVLEDVTHTCGSLFVPHWEPYDGPEPDLKAKVEPLLRQLDEITGSREETYRKVIRPKSRGEQPFAGEGVKEGQDGE